jgi:hypothetical protein
MLDDRDPRNRELGPELELSGADPAVGCRSQRRQQAGGGSIVRLHRPRESGQPARPGQNRQAFGELSAQALALPVIGNDHRDLRAVRPGGPVEPCLADNGAPVCRNDHAPVRPSDDSEVPEHRFGQARVRRQEPLAERRRRQPSIEGADGFLVGRQELANDDLRPVRQAERRRLGCRRTSSRNEHRNLMPVPTVAIAEMRDEVTFLESGPEHDVRGDRTGEQCASQAHRGGRPHGDQHPEQQRVPDDAVQQPGLERRTRRREPTVVADDLPHPEHVEVVDEERRPEHQRPPGEGHCPDPDPPQLAADAPYRPGHRSPLPHQQRQHGVRRQNVGGTLDRRWNELRPPPLEPRARHHAVLRREQRQQPQIDRDRDGHGRPSAIVDAAGRGDPLDETDHADEQREEPGVHDDAVNGHQPTGDPALAFENDASHFGLPGAGRSTV